MKRRTFLTATAVASAQAEPTLALAQATPEAATHGGYAPVNGLEMYYEIHGEGAPLVLLHGGPSTIDVPGGQLLAALGETREVIAIERGMTPRRTRWRANDRRNRWHE